MSKGKERPESERGEARIGAGRFQRTGRERKEEEREGEASGWSWRRKENRKVEGRENGIRRSSRRENRRREIAENFLLKVEPGLMNQFCTSLYFDESQHPLEGILLAASSTTHREEDLC